jgi:putative transposase
VKDFPNKGFNSIDEARKWVHQFVQQYNQEFLHSGIKYVTPYQRHYGLDMGILAKREEVYQSAKESKP